MVTVRSSIPVLLTLLFACGGSSGPTADKVCGNLAQAQCTKRMTCTNGAGITRTFGDMNTCLTREKLACVIGLAAPKTGNSPTLTADCVAAFTAYSCADFLNNNPPAACIVAGPGATGAACTFAGQCASDFCTNNKTSLCGTCGAAPSAGAACSASNCGHEQACVASTMTCAALGASGAACNATTPCGADLTCSGASASKMGTCVTPVAAAGAACGGAMPGCDGTMGLSCSGAAGSKTCALTSLVADGMPCGALADGSFAGCAAGGSCYTRTGIAEAGQMGTCKAAAADGAACDMTLGPPCLTPARCIVTGTSTSGTCTVPTDATCG